MDKEDKPNADQSASPPSAPTQEPKKVDAMPAAPPSAQQFHAVEERMTAFERSTVRWTRVAVGVSVLAAIFICLQWWEMHTGSSDTHNLAVAAGNQATWTQHLSDNMKIQGDRTQELADRMKDQADRTKTIADQAVVQANAAATTARTAQRSLYQSIADSQLDQRAWVGLAGFTTVGGSESADHKTFSFQDVQIAIRNSGKTPAINLSASTMQTSLNWDQKISDYDTMTADFNKQRGQLADKTLADMIRQNPQMAETLRAEDAEWRKETAAREAKYAIDLPAGQVLAPGVAIEVGTTSASYGVRDDVGMRRMIVYILGKITYNDIFTGTKLHTTKFCLMRRGGDHFTSCPTGNSMD
jgi:hypothetical protein